MCQLLLNYILINFCCNSGIDNVYALINNAGVFYHPFKLTEDGFEITFQTNYLGM